MTVRLVASLREWLEADAADPWVVRTSGSTGEPKDVLLSRDALLASAHATHERLGGPGRWVLAVPTSGVAGLQVVLRSLVAGDSPVPLGDGGWEAAVAEPGVRYASVVPTQLHRLAESGRLAVLAALDAVLVGGAAVPADLLEAARAAGVRVVRTYGMSETCGGCVYDGVPLDGVRLRIDDGQIMIAGPVLFDGYAGHPRTEEWFATADRGEIGDDGRLRVLGRIDDVVVSGGVNVPLPAVTEALRGVEAVRDVEVLGVPDAEWGTRVVAFVVPTDAVCLDALRVDELRDAVEAAGRPRAWGPRQVVLLDELPLLPGGKVDRVRLRGQA